MTANKTIRSLVLVFVFLMLIAMKCKDGNLVVDIPNTGLIQGTVTIDGIGVDGISVLLSYENKLSSTQLKGLYSFDSLPVGVYAITISGFPSNVIFATTALTANIATSKDSVTVNFSGVTINTGETPTPTPTPTSTPTPTVTPTPGVQSRVGTYTGDNGCGFGSAVINSCSDSTCNVTFPGNSATDCPLSGTDTYNCDDLTVFNEGNHTCVMTFVSDGFDCDTVNTVTFGNCNESLKGPN